MKKYYKRPMNKWYNRKIVEDEDEKKYTLTLDNAEHDEGFNIVVSDVIT